MSSLLQKIKHKNDFFWFTKLHISSNNQQENFKFNQNCSIKTKEKTIYLN